MLKLLMCLIPLGLGIHSIMVGITLQYASGIYRTVQVLTGILCIGVSIYFMGGK